MTVTANTLPNSTPHDFREADAFTVGEVDGRPVMVVGPAPYTAAEGPTGITAPGYRRTLATFTVEDGAPEPCEVVTVELLITGDASASIVRRTPRGGTIVITEHATAADAMSVALSACGWGPLDYTAAAERDALAEVDPLG